MNIVSIDDRTLIILVGIFAGTASFTLLLFSVVLVRVRGVAPQFKGTHIWPYICLVVCAVIILLLSLRGYLSSEMIATLLGTTLGYAFGSMRRKEE